eukprot:2492720-Prymnesium_polylepis.1
MHARVSSSASSASYIRRWNSSSPADFDDSEVKISFHVRHTHNHKALLGERYIGALPLVLKLIYLEVQGWDALVDVADGADVRAGVDDSSIR